MEKHKEAIITLIACLLILISFFLPWIRFEVVDFEAYELPWVAREYFPSSIYLSSYLIYLLPIFTIYILLSYLFSVNILLRYVQWLLVFFSLFSFLIIFLGDITNEIPVTIRYGAVANVVAGSLLFYMLLKK